MEERVYLLELKDDTIERIDKLKLPFERRGDVIYRALTGKHIHTLKLEGKRWRCCYEGCDFTEKD